MKLIEFEDMSKGTVLINPDNVSSICTRSEGIVQIVHTNGYFTSLDYKGVEKDKALWYVAETLRLGHHPYADSSLSYRDNNWERNAPKEIKYEENLSEVV